MGIILYQLFIGHKWRIGWDSNRRYAYTYGGFQDRCLNPLGRPSRTRPACWLTKPKPPPKFQPPAKHLERL